MKYIPVLQMRLMSMLYKPFNETKSRFMAIRHELAAFDWRVDTSEMMTHYPVVLTYLEEVGKNMQVGMWVRLPA